MCHHSWVYCQLLAWSRGTGQSPTRCAFWLDAWLNHHVWAHYNYKQAAATEYSTSEQPAGMIDSQSSMLTFSRSSGEPQTHVTATCSELPELLPPIQPMRIHFTSGFTKSIPTTSREHSGGCSNSFVTTHSTRRGIQMR
jgi:hypothetical protein